MVQVFEQYLRVASLKESADRMQRESGNTKWEGAGAEEGGKVPEIGVEGVDDAGIRNELKDDITESTMNQPYASQPIIHNGAGLPASVKDMSTHDSAKKNQL